MVLILGAGYTGSRVAAKLMARGYDITCIGRRQIDLAQPESMKRLSEVVPDNCVVLHSIPSLPSHADAKLVAELRGKARRMVYISTTGVYGDIEHIDESTVAAPRNDREFARLLTETAVREGPWESLILRPAAIYGPDRGVHVSMAQGRYALHNGGQNFVSRIHVEDLAELVTAGLLSDLQGIYPVADEHPCTSREIAEYCSQMFQLPLPVETAEAEVPVSRRNNRRVDGRAVFRLLGVKLKYPSYVEGLAMGRA